MRHLSTHPRRPRRVADVRAFIDESGVSAILSPERVFDLKVTVSEACANAVEHGQSEVRIMLWQLRDRVTAEISNVGRFVPRGRTSPEAAQQHRGLGLGLMLTLADEIQMNTKRRGRTTIWLTFDRDGY